VPPIVKVPAPVPVAPAPTMTPPATKAAEPPAPKPTPAPSPENQERIAIYEKMRADRQPNIDQQRKAYLADPKRFGAALDIDIKVTEVEKAARAEAGKYGNVSVPLAVQRMELAQIRGETAIAKKFDEILRTAVVEHRTAIPNHEIGLPVPARVQQRPTAEQIKAQQRAITKSNGISWR